ncbi:MAG: FecR family protein [Elusimicrobiota bacterium]
MTAPELSHAGAKAVTVSGEVQARNTGSLLWNEVKSDAALAGGQEVKTGRGANVTIGFEDGSKVELGPKSSFVLEEASSGEAAMKLNLGKMKAWVTSKLSRRFRVRTPTAVCSVRGTEFGVSVAPSGATSVDLFRGTLGVADNRGNELMLQEGQRVDVSQQGVGKPISISEADAAADSRERADLKREVGLEMTKEQVQAAAALEMKSAIYQQGKAMIDVNGHRVRIEDYIMLPSPDTFKLVVLNERVDRFDYFYYKGTFNQTLPTDLTTAFKQVPGCVGSPCQYYITSYEVGRSNTQDNVLENASGGHQVDLNSNVAADDDVAFAFDPSQNEYVDVPNGTAFYGTLYDTYALKYNGIAHTEWDVAADPSGTPTGRKYDPTAAAAIAAGCVNGSEAGCGGLRSYGDTDADGDTFDHATNYNAHNMTVIQPSTCDNLDGPCVIPTEIQNSLNQSLDVRCTELDNCTGYREENKFHHIVYRKSNTGLWDKWDSYIIDDEGQVASFGDFAGITSGADYRARMLKWNYQQIITASEFGGRKIDLVFEPKVLIESGLIQ